VVLVVGDVNSTVACALVGAKAGCLVAHVEAGLRSRDWSMPEEINRVVTDRLSDYLFAPSSDAVDNLTAEGYRSDQIHLVGNVMIDTLLANLERAPTPIGALRSRSTSRPPDRYALATLASAVERRRCRPVGVADRSAGRIAEKIPVMFPAHPRTAQRLQGGRHRARMVGLRVVEPFGYLDFLAFRPVLRSYSPIQGGSRRRRLHSAYLA
jgi:UDP-N-acetylglucosamine 2-epimerase (non-hydrolysing)